MSLPESMLTANASVKSQENNQLNLLEAPTIIEAQAAEIEAREFKEQLESAVTALGERISQTAGIDQGQAVRKGELLVEEGLKLHLAATQAPNPQYDAMMAQNPELQRLLLKENEQGVLVRGAERFSNNLISDVVRSTEDARNAILNDPVTNIKEIRRKTQVEKGSALREGVAAVIEARETFNKQIDDLTKAVLTPAPMPERRADVQAAMNFHNVNEQTAQKVAEVVQSMQISDEQKAREEAASKEIQAAKDDKKVKAQETADLRLEYFLNNSPIDLRRISENYLDAIHELMDPSTTNKDREAAQSTVNELLTMIEDSVQGKSIMVPIRKALDHAKKLELPDKPEVKPTTVQDVAEDAIGSLEAEGIKLSKGQADALKDAIERGADTNTLVLLFGLDDAQTLTVQRIAAQHSVRAERINATSVEEASAATNVVSKAEEKKDSKKPETESKVDDVIADASLSFAEQGHDDESLNALIEAFIEPGALESQRTAIRDGIKGNIKESRAQEAIVANPERVKEVVDGLRIREILGLSEDVQLSDDQIRAAMEYADGTPKDLRKSGELHTRMLGAKFNRSEQGIEASKSLIQNLKDMSGPKPAATEQPTEGAAVSGEAQTQEAFNDEQKAILKGFTDVLTVATGITPDQFAALVSNQDLKTLSELKEAVSVLNLQSANDRDYTFAIADAVANARAEISAFAPTSTQSPSNEPAAATQPAPTRARETATSDASEVGSRERPIGDDVSEDDLNRFRSNVFSNLEDNDPPYTLAPDKKQAIIDDVRALVDDYKIDGNALEKLVMQDEDPTLQQVFDLIPDKSLIKDRQFAGIRASITRMREAAGTQAPASTQNQGTGASGRPFRGGDQITNIDFYRTRQPPIDEKRVAQQVKSIINGVNYNSRLEANKGLDGLRDRVANIPRIEVEPVGKRINSDTQKILEGQITELMTSTQGATRESVDQLLAQYPNLSRYTKRDLAFAILQQDFSNRRPRLDGTGSTEQSKGKGGKKELDYGRAHGPSRYYTVPQQGIEGRSPSTVVLNPQFATRDLPRSSESDYSRAVREASGNSGTQEPGVVEKAKEAASGVLRRFREKMSEAVSSVKARIPHVPYVRGVIASIDLGELISNKGRRMDPPAPAAPQPTDNLNPPQGGGSGNEGFQPTNDGIGSNGNERPMGIEPTASPASQPPTINSRSVPSWLRGSDAEQTGTQQEEDVIVIDQETGGETEYSDQQAEPTPTKDDLPDWLTGDLSVEPLQKDMSFQDQQRAAQRRVELAQNIQITDQPETIQNTQVVEGIGSQTASAQPTHTTRNAQRLDPSLLGDLNLPEFDGAANEGGSVSDEDDLSKLETEKAGYIDDILQRAKLEVAPEIRAQLLKFIDPRNIAAYDQEDIYGLIISNINTNFDSADIIAGLMDRRTALYEQYIGAKVVDAALEKQLVEFEEIPERGKAVLRDLLNPSLALPSSFSTSLGTQATVLGFGFETPEKREALRLKILAVRADNSNRLKGKFEIAGQNSVQTKKSPPTQQYVKAPNAGRLDSKADLETAIENSDAAQIQALISSQGEMVADYVRNTFYRLKGETPDGIKISFVDGDKKSKLEANFERLTGEKFNPNLDIDEIALRFFNPSEGVGAQETPKSAEKAEALKIDIGEYSVASIGHPNENQDRVYTNSKSTIMVIDGMGGHVGGEDAAKAGVRAARPLEKLTPQSTQEEIIVAYQEYFRNAQTEISKLPHSESDAVAALATAFQTPEGRKAVLGWVGDARVYGYNKDGNLIKLTSDDNAFRQLLNGADDSLKTRLLEQIEEFGDNAISEADYEKYSPTDRAIMKMLFSQRNVATNALSQNTPHMLTVDAEQFAGLIAMSDGITDNLTTSEMQAIVQDGLERNLLWSKISQNLVMAAYKRSREGQFRSKPDDCSVIGMSFSN